MSTIFEDAQEIQEIRKISKELKKASVTMTKEEARDLVDLYYITQKDRIRANNQIAAIHKPHKDWEKEVSKLTHQVEKGNATQEELDELIKQEPIIEPHKTLDYFLKTYLANEKDMKACLEIYAKSKPIGRWLLSITGIGPVIAAGLIAHIDISKVQTAGQIQAFGGLDPNRMTWKKGEKRPWNASLKTLYWKIGQSFVKTSNRESDIYGKIYQERKVYEKEKNENLEYLDQALDIVKTRKWTEKTMWMKEIYETGMLPDCHIAARAARYATKRFLSHFFDVYYEMYHHEKPPKPYPIAQLGHAHMVPAPNWPMDITEDELELFNE